MNRKQVFDVLTFIKDSYPQFHVDQSKIDHWTRLLRGQNPAIIMRNAERYVVNFKYPPTLADLREVRLASHSSDFLQKRDMWEREAVGRQSRS